MFGAIVILSMSIAAFFLGYQAIRHKRTFWFEDVEKNNKKSKIWHNAKGKSPSGDVFQS